MTSITGGVPSEFTMRGRPAQKMPIRQISPNLPSAGIVIIEQLMFGALDYLFDPCDAFDLDKIRESSGSTLVISPETLIVIKGYYTGIVSKAWPSGAERIITIGFKDSLSPSNEKE
jgi:hypothetical protein